MIYKSASDPEEHLEPWETPETRARNEQWRGEASDAAARERDHYRPRSESHDTDVVAFAQLLREAVEAQFGRMSAIYHGGSVSADEVRALRAKMELFRRHFARAQQSALLRLSELEEQLRLLQEEARQDNWDGAGAKAVLAETALIATHVLMKLPLSWPKPELGAGNSGQVVLDWIAGGVDFSLTVEVWPDRKLVYSALFGDDVLHGVEEWRGALPKPIELALERLWGSAFNP